MGGVARHSSSPIFGSPVHRSVSSAVLEGTTSLDVYDSVQFEPVFVTCNVVVLTIRHSIHRVTTIGCVNSMLSTARSGIFGISSRLVTIICSVSSKVLL